MKPAHQIKIVSFLIHPAFLAFLFFVLVLLLSDIHIRRYRTQTGSFQQLNKIPEKSVFIDINHNGTRETIRAYNLRTNATVTAGTANNTFIEAWNLPGLWYELPDFILKDYDGNGTEEMYALTLNKGDSVLVHQLVLEQNQQILKSRFVCRTIKFNDEPDFLMQIIGFCDLNGDSREDLVFHINAGFSLQPRAIFAWDLVNDTIFHSPFHEINSKYTQPLICSYDSTEHQNLLYGRSTATDNNKENVAYPDTASYAVVYTSGLEFLFEPIATGGRQSTTSTYPFSRQGQEYILAISQDPRRFSKEMELILFNRNGSEFLRKSTDLFDNCNYRCIHWFNEQLLFIRPDEDKNTSHFYHINEDLEFTPAAEHTGRFDIILPCQIDRDPDQELILINRSEDRVLILQDNLKYMAEAQIPLTDFINGYITLKKSTEKGSVLHIQTSESSFELQLNLNRMYPLRWLVYLSIYLMLVLTLYLLRQMFTYSNRKRTEREKILINYQLQTILNQLNPHFTFNAINSIGDAVLEGRNEEAYEYFTKLSDLIRKSMTNAMTPYKSLGEEVEFVREYLEIEKYRFGDRLEWHIEMDPGVDRSLPVPKMLIHIFVENALKHGLFHLKDTGYLHINIKTSNRSTVISIMDNGVGMDKAFKIENRKGKGLEILDRYLEIYNASFPHRISYRFTGNTTHWSSGTMVIIHIGEKIIGR